MKTNPDPTIEGFLADLEATQAKCRNLMITVNCLLAKAGRSPRFSDDEIAGRARVPALVADGQFRANYGLTTAIREYMFARYNVGLSQPGATLDEIIEALRKGDFPTGEAADGDPAKRRKAFREHVQGLLERNSENFIRLPGDRVGLKQMHPEICRQRRQPKQVSAAKPQKSVGKPKSRSKESGATPQPPGGGSVATSGVADQNDGGSTGSADKPDTA